MMVCCDATATFPVKVGEFQIQIFEGQLGFIDPDTRQTTFTSDIRTGNDPRPGQHFIQPPITLSVEDGAQLNEGSNTIEVFMQTCNFDIVEIDILAEITGRRMDDRQLVVIGVSESFRVVNSCAGPITTAAPPQQIVETIVRRPLDVETFDSFQVEAPVGVETQNLSSMMPPQVPPEAYTEVFAVGAVVLELSQDDIDAAFEGMDPLYPSGVTDETLVVTGFMPPPMMPGPYLFCWQCTQERIPFDGMVEQNVRFLFDRDNDPANNGMGLFDNDTLLGTDTRYEVQFSSFGGWFLTATDAQLSMTNPFPLPFSTSARIIFQGQVQMAVIPLSEIADPQPTIGARFATLAHGGDFGISGILPWSGDSTPPQGADLIQISLDAFPE